MCMIAFGSAATGALAGRMAARSIFNRQIPTAVTGRRSLSTNIPRVSNHQPLAARLLMPTATIGNRAIASSSRTLVQASTATEETSTDAFESALIEILALRRVLDALKENRSRPIAEQASQQDWAQSTPDHDLRQAMLDHFQEHRSISIEGTPETGLSFGPASHEPEDLKDSQATGKSNEDGLAIDPTEDVQASDLAQPLLKGNLWRHVRFMFTADDADREALVALVAEGKPLDGQVTVQMWKVGRPMDTIYEIVTFHPPVDGEISATHRGVRYTVDYRIAGHVFKQVMEDETGFIETEEEAGRSYNLMPNDPQRPLHMSFIDEAIAHGIQRHKSEPDSVYNQPARAIGQNEVVDMYLDGDKLRFWLDRPLESRQEGPMGFLVQDWAVRVGKLLDDGGFEYFTTVATVRTKLVPIDLVFEHNGWPVIVNVTAHDDGSYVAPARDPAQTEWAGTNA
ncbi:hypothetical protein IAU60_006848 [Kwoniella sp. DSM 27419]